jgi:S-(hydroxymethyl)glutathione dehydrogenase/alcohol dehydrogenase
VTARPVRALVLSAAGGALEPVDLIMDDPGPREVVVRTRAAGLCHTDLSARRGDLPCPLPIVLGHEAAGIVEAVGPAVTRVRPGDRVITCLSVFCGSCDACLRGRPALCDQQLVRRAPGDPPRLHREGTPVAQLGQLGAFAERMLVHEHAVVPFTAEVPFDVAALFGCAVTTGLGAVFHTARVEPGTSVAVLGCGGVGLHCVQGARLAGADRIIAVDIAKPKLEQALQLGATDVLPADGRDVVAEVLELTGGGVHHAFEVIGDPASIRQAFSMLRRGGTCTVVGLVPHGQDVAVPGAELLLEKKLQGSRMGSNRFPLDIPRYLSLYRQGRLRLDGLIARHVTLEDVDAALAALPGPVPGRTVLTFPESEL